MPNLGEDGCAACVVQPSFFRRNLSLARLIDPSWSYIVSYHKEESEESFSYICLT